MPKVTGRRLALSLPRRWIADLMRISRGMPVASVEREFQLGDLVELRQRVQPTPSWLSLFIKAFALTAQQQPIMRRSYQSWPWPHLFEADFSIASVAVSRDVEGEPAVLFGLLNGPENQSLRQISQHLQDFKTRPLEEIHSFRQLLRISSYPGWLRRLFWSYGYYWSGRKRANTFGTFGVSVLGSSGVTLLDLVFPVATTFTLGPIRDTGQVLVRYFFDHRVLDGATAAEALRSTERHLQQQIRQELVQLLAERATPLN